jgi:hypothetical protein
VAVLLAVIAVAVLVVHVRSLLAPRLINDDMQIVREAWTWERVRTNLWVPMNEHCWPVFRLAGYAVTQCSGGLAGVPLAAAVFSRLALLATVGGLYQFVRRERGPLAGLVSATAFGVSSVYMESVYWFAATPGVLCLATAVVGLLGAQRWLAGGRWGLAVAGGAAAVAPGWFGGGVLVGPLLAVYLVRRGPGGWWAWAVPVAGTFAYFALCLPLAGGSMMRPAHHNGRSTLEVFNPTVAAENTVRAITDQLLLGAVGVGGVSCPLWVTAVGTAAAVAAAGWWWWRAGRPRVVLVGGGFILLNYLLVYSLRAEWSYPEQMVTWSRYNTFPQFGLALVFGGGVWNTTALTRRQWWGVLAAVAVLTAIHAPVAYLRTPAQNPELAAELERVQEADRVCRRERIAGEDAARVLHDAHPKWPHSDLWQCVWGSANPVPKSDEEIRKVLLE